MRLRSKISLAVEGVSQIATGLRGCRHSLLDGSGVVQFVMILP